VQRFERVLGAGRQLTPAHSATPSTIHATASRYRALDSGPAERCRLRLGTPASAPPFHAAPAPSGQRHPPCPSADAAINRARPERLDSTRQPYEEPSMPKAVPSRLPPPFHWVEEPERKRLCL